MVSNAAVSSRKVSSYDCGLFGTLTLTDIGDPASIQPAYGLIAILSSASPTWTAKLSIPAP